MTDEAGRGRSRSPLLVVAALIVVIAGFRAAASLLVPLLLALFVTVLSLPILNWLIRRGLPSRLAVLATILADVGVLTGFGFLLSGAVAEFTESAPIYVEQLYRIVKAVLASLEAQGFVLTDWLKVDQIEPGALMNLMGGLVGGTLVGALKSFSFTLLVVLMVVFLLFESVGFPEKVQQALGERGYEPERFRRMVHEMQLYLGIKTVVGIAMGVLLGIWVAFLGIDFPLLWGLTAFLLHYIPNVGGFAAAVPPALLALIQHDVGKAFLVVLAFLVVELALGSLLEPHLMGRRFGLSTLVVFLSLVFWGWLWGPIGMLLSVPLTLLVKLYLKHSPVLRPYAMLLGPLSPSEPTSARPAKTPAAGEA